MQLCNIQFHQIVAFALATLLLGAGFAVAEDAPAVKAAKHVVAPTDSLFSVISVAWNEGDEGTLAAMVHPDGVRIHTGGGRDRLTHYSPSQAYYFFKNLFQVRKTLSFSFVRVQDNDDQDRTHALAAWSWQLEGVEKEQEEKIIFVLSIDEDRWLLSEINSIK